MYEKSFEKERKDKTLTENIEIFLHKHYCISGLFCQQ